MPPAPPWRQPEHCPGSLPYAPTAEQRRLDPLLAACAAHGMSESQVIELQFRHAQELRQQLQTLQLRTLFAIVRRP